MTGSRVSIASLVRKTPAWLRAFLLLALGFSGFGHAQEAPSDQVVFVGYNLKNYLKMQRRVGSDTVPDAPKPEREVAAVVTMLKKAAPDIIGLTEIGTEEDVRDLQLRLKTAGIDLPHATINRAFDEDRRVALLSKFPIVATDHQTSLTYMLGETRMLFRRGILDATVEVNPDYHLRLLGTHLKSKREVEEGDQALMRRNEAHLLRQHANDILSESPKTNLLVFGDFNDTRNETPIKAVQGKFGTPMYLKDIQAADELGYRWTYYWRYADQYSRFDYVFVSDALLGEVVRDEAKVISDPVWFTASDHRPVSVTITAKDK